MSDDYDDWLGRNVAAAVSAAAAAVHIDPPLIKNKSPQTQTFFHVVLYIYLYTEIYRYILYT